MSNRAIGTVIRVCPAGYGFLLTAAGDAFFHSSALPAHIPFEESLGRRIDFALESENGKLRASDLYEFTGGEKFTGTVGLIPPNRPFAFVRPSDGGPEIFFHRDDVRAGDFDSLAGKAVTFEKQETIKGPRAVCVEVAP